jgi:transposase-like protein
VLQKTYALIYRDLEEMMRERGLSLDHTTIYRWVQAYALELEKRIRPHLRPTNNSYRVDETYVKIKGAWKYLYRAVDSMGQTIDFMLSAKRDARAAKRFFRKMLKAASHSSPRVINVDQNPAYPPAVELLKKKETSPSARREPEVEAPSARREPRLETPPVIAEASARRGVGSFVSRRTSAAENRPSSQKVGFNARLFSLALRNFHLHL